MYHRVATDLEACGHRGRFSPVATLEDGHGGKAHIGVDDHCYVLWLRVVGGGCPEGCMSAEPDRYRMTKHWFREAFEVLRELPPPA